MAETKARSRVSERLSGNGIDILIVDDDPNARLTLRAVLQPLGHNLVEAASGEEALRCVLRQEFAVIIMDVQMAHLNGYEAAALIHERERSRATPVIFVTAVDKDAEHIARGYAAGAVDYLFKPYSPDILRSKVSAFAEMFRYAKLSEINDELEARVKERTTVLRESVAGLETFAHGVSHDLQAPLRAIQGLGRILSEEYADRLDEQGQDFLRRITSAAGRMDDLIQDLLAFSRLGRMEIECEPLRLEQAVSDALCYLEAPIHGTNAEITCEDLAVSVLAHRATLVQIVMNLLTNAVKFVAAGTRPRVRIGSSQTETEVRLWVADNGIGIDPSCHERIFQVFERLHGVEAYPGTGLGLAIVRRGAERMGGRVGLESEPSKGSRFWVDLLRPTQVAVEVRQDSGELVAS